MKDLNKFSIQEIENKLDEFSEFNDARGAYEYYKDFMVFMDGAEKDEIDNKIFNLIVRLKFLAIRFFDDWKEVEELLRDHFEQIYIIKHYDLWANVKIRLLDVPVIIERNEIKRNLRTILLECERIIINRQKYANNDKLPVTVADWLNNYRASLGGGIVDSLAKTKYLTNGEYVNLLNKEDKNKITVLINFYEKLKKPSDTPQGFEEEVPIEIDGKNFIFRDGELEEIGPNIKNLIKSIIIDDDVSAGTNKKGVISPPMTSVEKEIDQLKNKENQYQKNSIERLALEEEINKKKKVEQLIAMANKYKKGSLEYRALMEEVEKIKKR